MHIQLLKKNRKLNCVVIRYEAATGSCWLFSIDCQKPLKSHIVKQRWKQAYERNFPALSTCFAICSAIRLVVIFIQRHSLSPDSFTDGSVIEVQTSLAQVSARSQKRFQCTVHQGPFGRWDKLLFLSFPFGSAGCCTCFLFPIASFLFVVFFLNIRLVDLFCKLVSYCEAFRG